MLCRTRMPSRSLVTALALLSSIAVAEAGPVTAGVGVGRFQSERDWDGESDSTVQLFARLGLTGRISGQLELMKIDSTYGTTVRTGTALIVVELGNAGKLVPTMFAGVGIDRGDGGYYTEHGTHIEGGFGLEYRFEGGLSLMADVRMGGRSVDSEDVLVMTDGGVGYLGLYAPALIEGEYRSARLGVGVRF